MTIVSPRFLALWLKAWREARAAFWGCFFLTCLNSWLALDRLRDAVASGRIVNPSTFDIYDGSIRVWAIAYSVLGAGSLLWERRLGGQAFTRVLPVRELYVNLMRALVGVFFVLILSSIPSTMANALHRLIFPTFPVPDSVDFMIVSIALGLAGYGCAMFAGSFASNFWGGIAAGWLFPTVLSGMFSILPFSKSFAPIRLLRVYGGNSPVALDWTVLFGYLGGGLLAMVVAAYVSEQRLARRFRP